MFAYQWNIALIIVLCCHIPVSNAITCHCENNDLCEDGICSGGNACSKAIAGGISISKSCANCVEECNTCKLFNSEGAEVNVCMCDTDFCNYDFAPDPPETPNVPETPDDPYVPDVPDDPYVPNAPDGRYDPNAPDDRYDPIVYKTRNSSSVARWQGLFGSVAVILVLIMRS